LPSSREIATELGVSRNTVNAAYQELIAEGFVEGRERLGLFVNAALTRNSRMATGGSSAGASDSARSRIDWSARTRRFSDAGLPHISKPEGWFEAPYPFLAGQVDVRSFPVSAWLRCLREAMYQPHIYHSLQDSIGADDPLLVEMIRRQLLPARGIEVQDSQIMITDGSQHGLDLLSRLLLSDGSRVVFENPGYLDARHIFMRNAASITPMPVDESGCCPPASLSGMDLIYVTPSHHHPTNVTLSIGRRRELLALATASGTIVVEDDYDSEFRYRGSPTPALKALESADDVVYLGTFSKFLSPGLRIGYLVGPEALIQELKQLRRYVNRHPSGQTQRALALLIESGDYQRAVRRARGHLMRKWETLTAAVNHHLPWTTMPPPGGVSLWMQGPPELDCRALIERAADRGILLERGDILFVDAAANRRFFRIGFSAIQVASIEPGIKLLGQIVDQLLNEA
jgi:Transcriptional regulators containing a DNA-binding HTH domain and an aminotransferase domain (MocR family) and their eukaryotic orthologs